MTRRASLVGLAFAALVCSEGVLHAHSGPPFPILSNAIAGAYSVSLWTDPDTTDNAKPAGRFWVMLEPADGRTAIPSGTQASVAVRPLDRPGPVRAGRADPVNGSVTNQFVAVLMDHEGPFGVHVTIEGPLGRASLDSRVDATYDVRPAPALLALYLLPFVAVGALWVKVMVRRRRQGAPLGRRRSSSAAELPKP